MTVDDKWDGIEDDARGSRKPGPLCGVARMLTTVPVEYVDTVAALVEDRSVSSAALGRALRKRLGDASPSRWVLEYHRRQDCSCRGEES